VEGGETSYFPCTAWPSWPGDRVIVYGSLRQRSWETPEGERRRVVEVQAEDAGPSLRWATAKPERTNAKASASKGGQITDEPPF
jgi:single-strand DNA-binding protein